METRKSIKLFFSILLWNLLPSIYFLVRAHFVAISGADIDIMGQMEWFDLIDEVIATTLTVPLYYILKKGKTDAGQNFKITSIAFVLYSAFALIIALRIGSITKFMQAEGSARYLVLQTIAMLAGFLLNLMLLLFTLHDKSNVFYIMTVLKLVLLAIMDSFFIPRYLEYGAAYADIIVNSILAVFALIIAIRSHLIKLHTTQATRPLYIDWIKKGIPAGLQIFLDNWIYAVLVVRMVNVVSDAGNYWMANNFIWGWLLVPVITLGEVIKRSNMQTLRNKSIWITGGIITGVWFCTMPAWKWFLGSAMSLDAETVLPIVWALVPFYFAYIVCAIIDSWFVSTGRTWCTAVISVIVNIGYYGIVYLTVFRNLSERADISFIIHMFGYGMVVHMVVAIILYFVIRKRQKATVKSTIFSTKK